MKKQGTKNESSRVDHIEKEKMIKEKIKGDKVLIDKEFCKGCSLCVNFCPNEVLELSEDINSSGYHYSVFKNKDKCTSCSFCAIVCPDACIEVFKE